jgi:hydrogenase expression/formation protein HypC
MCLGVPGKITEIYDANGIKMGKIDFGGIVKEACLEYIPDADIGEYAIIHAGFAITRLNEEEALKTLAMFQEMGRLAEELGLEEAQEKGDMP